MSLINKEVNDFKVQAYVGKDFKEVTKKESGKWRSDKVYLCGQKQSE